jgi:hypothetical protein
MSDLSCAEAVSKYGKDHDARKVRCLGGDGTRGLIDKSGWSNAPCRTEMVCILLCLWCSLES